jgi:hypothetical protein
VKATSTATVKTSESSAAAVASAVLGECGRGCVKESCGSDSGKKSVQQGGFPHFHSPST